MKTRFVQLGLFLAISAAAGAADPAAAEAKLRDNLRNALLQARTLQGERDALQAAKTQLEAEKKTAADQAAALQKQLAADKDAADKTIAELREKSLAENEQVAQLKTALEKWKAAHAEVTALAEKKEGERARLAQEKIERDRIIADQRTRNLGMYRIGTEVLNRYEKFGLGTALSAREPFTGLMRVKLENLVQDYGDKLSEQRIKPEAAPATPAPAPAAPAPAKPKKAEPPAPKSQSGTRRV